jgi:hypothetical protein
LKQSFSVSPSGVSFRLKVPPYRLLKEVNLLRSRENLEGSKPVMPAVAIAIGQQVSTAGNQPARLPGAFSRFKDASLITKGLTTVEVTCMVPATLIRSHPGSAPATPAYLLISHK